MSALLTAEFLCFDMDAWRAGRVDLAAQYVMSAVRMKPRKGVIKKTEGRMCGPQMQLDSVH
jgi:hypothetical protein